MRKGTLFLLALLPLLGGCWNSNELQTLAYGTALGFDYADGKYTAYVQVLNFANVAKLEGTEPGKNVPAWIGKGQGVTALEAITDINEASQLPMFWGHVSAIVVTDNVIKSNKYHEIADTLNRYREIRYNIRVYGTKEKLVDIFSVKSLLNFSPLESLLARPTKYYSQRPYIHPILGFQFIASINEPGYSDYLPSIEIDKTAWREDKHRKPMFRINGAYFFNNREYVGWMSESALKGVRWINEQLDMASINIPSGPESSAVVNLHSPHYRVQPIVRDGEVRFAMTLKFNGHISAMWGNLPDAEVERVVTAAVAEEIRATFERGVDKGIDVFRLSQQLYRDDPATFKRFIASRPFPLTKESLARVDVRIHIMHSGKFKGKK